MMIRISLVIYFLSLGQFSKAQIINQSDLPKQWQFYDSESDNIYGISALKAKKTILTNKNPTQQIIVAIIDEGIDINHSYLKNYIWTNKKEIPNNNIDDDKNGYIDDINGWNFVGNTISSCTEDIRDYILLRPKFENLKDSTGIKRQHDFKRWKFVVKQKEQVYNEKTVAEDINYFQEFIDDFNRLLEYYKEKLNIDDVDYKILKAYPITDQQDTLLLKNYLKRIQFLKINPDSLNFSLNKKIKEYSDIMREIDNDVKYVNTLIENSNPYYYFHKENIFPEKINQKKYGNNDINPKGDHGTACAGFITDYNYLIESNNILIMPIKILVYSTQDQNDKDLFNGIKYAVDNGAKVINMSFSNSTCLNRKLIDKAFRYAQKKGVIIVQSAGNQSINIDNPIRFPSAELVNGKRVDNVIRVGASSYSSNNLACNFSNYGQKQVDVFAPGEYLYYPTLNNKFKENGNGTSFATPIVAGLVATLWSYYPHLTYRHIMNCILTPINKLDIEILQPNSDRKVRFSSLSKSGGIVNMYDAFKLAEEQYKK
jgi:cell wall-associated protease